MAPNLVHALAKQQQSSRGAARGPVNPLLAALRLFRRASGLLHVLVASVLALCSLHAAAYDIEAGYTGEVRQMTEKKTPYNTMLVDAGGKLILLSFDEGEYVGKLSVETTVMNHVFVLPQMLLSQNKPAIIQRIKANKKFPKLLEVYRGYLQTGKESQFDYYLKIRDSLVLDLVEQHKVQKLF